MKKQGSLLLFITCIIFTSPACVGNSGKLYKGSKLPSDKIAIIQLDCDSKYAFGCYKVKFEGLNVLDHLVPKGNDDKWKNPGPCYELLPGSYKIFIQPQQKLIKLSGTVSTSTYGNTVRSSSILSTSTFQPPGCLINVDLKAGKSYVLHGDFRRGRQITNKDLEEYPDGLWAVAYYPGYSTKRTAYKFIFFDVKIADSSSGETLAEASLRSGDVYSNETEKINAEEKRKRLKKLEERINN